MKVSLEMHGAGGEFQLNKLSNSDLDEVRKSYDAGTVDDDGLFDGGVTFNKQICGIYGIYLADLTLEDAELENGEAMPSGIVLKNSTMVEKDVIHEHSFDDGDILFIYRSEGKLFGSISFDTGEEGFDPAKLSMEFLYISMKQVAEGFEGQIFAGIKYNDMPVELEGDIEDNSQTLYKYLVRVNKGSDGNTSFTKIYSLNGEDGLKTWEWQ
jgi:hypothetical protein